MYPEYKRDDFFGGEDTDALVPESSQRANFKSTKIMNVVHSKPFVLVKELESVRVAERVVELLKSGLYEFSLTN